MTRTTTTALCCLTLASLYASRAAAEQPHHALGFTVDAGVASNRDDILVPRALTGPRLAVGATYAGLLGAGTLHAEIHLAASAVFDRDGNAGLSFDHALGADYVFDLGNAGGLRQAVGPALGVDTDVLALSGFRRRHSPASTESCCEKTATAARSAYSSSEIESSYSRRICAR